MVDSGIRLIDRAEAWRGSPAIDDGYGSHDYQQLLVASARSAAALLDRARDRHQGQERDLGGARVALMATPGFGHVAAQWGIWRAGGVAVPLCDQHPEPELRHVLHDADVSLVVGDPAAARRLEPLCRQGGWRWLPLEELVARDEGGRSPRLPWIDEQRPAMLVYTSGTTSRPKGVVLTHANLAAQVTSLVAAWRWRRTDHILGVLPLHHVHGIVNVVCCALWSGARCELLPRFDAERVWQRLVACCTLTLFMAVPTIYRRLIAAWEAESAERQREMSAAGGRLRLMVSGSAPLPVSVLERWQQITGQVLLERYGMTEVGMVLSNPLDGERAAGHVGWPLPEVQLRLVDDRGSDVAPGAPGEILVRGPGVFSAYWRQPDATRAAFDAGGWFRSGDLAVQRERGGPCRIVGRRSVDIIKSGGYKVSALEIEEVLREHPDVGDCAVVGVADAEWGERVVAAVTCAPGRTLDTGAIGDWCRARLAPYKVPRRWTLMDELPRNAVGKVRKPELARVLGADDAGGDRVDAGFGANSGLANGVER